MKTKFLQAVPVAVEIRFRGNRAGIFLRTIVLTQILCLLPAITSWAGPTRTLSGHVPSVVGQLQPLGRLAATTNLHLAIGLPLRNTGALTTLLQQIYDPASPNYRHYLTPAQFAAQFGPTEADYQAVIEFAKSNALAVTGTWSNRTVVDVSGPVADIERAFRVKMLRYQHPTESRTFYAPDVEPSLDLATPVLHIFGMNNYALPRPMNIGATPHKRLTNSKPDFGTGPWQQTYMGADFRNVYAPGVSLTGSNQVVALVEYDGYYPNDITYYENVAGLPHVPLQVVPVDGGIGTPGGGNVEVALDIEMAIAMAPGLSKVLVYEAPNWSTYVIDILTKIAQDNLAKQISCSWTFGDDSSTSYDQVYQQYASQGQSFFQASGDHGGYTSTWPDQAQMDSPYVTLVGGTTLTTSNTIGGTVTNVFYESETVWNQNPGGAGNTNNSVSGGGIGTVHSIPNWQQGINLSACGGSTSQRNVPDVALTAQSVFVAANNGWEYNEGGTSAAAPLWAGFTALINQQAAANGQPAVGFLNPAIYAIGESAIYSNCFNDVTTGNNETYYSPNQYSAVSGYDLCTGWGTPTGSNLINALSAPPTEGNSWISGAGGKWEAAAHWSLTIPPDSLQSIFISNAPSKTVTIDATTSGSNPSTMTNRNVIVSAPAGTVNTLFLNNAGTTTTPLQILNSLTITSGGAVAVTNSTLLLDPVNSVSGIDGVIVGETASDKQLTVAGGGQLTGVNGYIGYNSSSEDDYVLVSGSGSAWSNSRYLYVGDYGSFNELSIADGGTVSSAGCAIGNYPNANFNGMVVSGPGAVCASSGTLYVGQYGSFNQLYIQDGGVVSNANGYIGWAAGGNDNAGSVTGTGSGWYNSGTLSVGYSSSGNTLTIAGGGIVSNADGYIGYNHGANGNAGTVTDPGSVWNSASDLYIGYYGSGNSLTITNGAAVLTQGTAGIGWWPSNVNNVVTVSGNGAQWLISGTLYVGYPGTGNQLVINPGGTVAASGAFIGEDYVTLANNNVLQVSGGNLFVTNSAGTGQLTVGLSTGPASLLLYSGTVVVDNLVANHNANSLIQLNGGLLASGGTSISNGQIFSVGDGVTAATFQLNGGVHSFANNLLIGNNATLTGCGTVNGNVVVGYGGTVLADCGTLTFVNVITNNGVLRVDGGSVLETYSNVVNNGTIDAINGGTSFHAGILNHGTILTPANVAISQASPSGQDFVVQVPSVTGHTYQLQYTTSLAPATWTNTGAPQSGTGAVLTFTDVGAITNSQRFYQVLVTAP